MSDHNEASREFHFTARDFERVRRMIYARAGIALAGGKEDLVYSRLARRLRACGEQRFDRYLDALEASATSPEWEGFTNALTTNLTSFFREAHHFDQLQQFLRCLPRDHHARIWCAAASTGEEPYSIAISAAEAGGRVPPPVEIVATDIDTQVLVTAARGVYPLERVAQLDKALLRRYFRRGTGPNEGYARILPELSGVIDFHALNLLEARWDLRGPFDAIFCRNVMIYFDKPTQIKLMRRLADLLVPNGLLFTGHSESFFNLGDMLKPCGRTAYRRVALGEVAA
ncbi:CheR family methyltransferase [Solimonas terrae]|uniref:Chemotaxis protein methyltransferase n=1 Tax=Solimonas terrae TaxID=1396819 RepID=A0A6M2BYN7_9GAMM|nr:chemotaxis protein CheR [Solimonas terrae]